MIDGIEHQRMAIDTGYWPLLRYDPRRAERGDNPLVLDSPAPKTELAKFMATENRFRIVERKDPARAQELEPPGAARGHETGRLLPEARRFDTFRAGRRCSRAGARAGPRKRQRRRSQAPGNQLTPWPAVSTYRDQPRRKRRG